MMFVVETSRYIHNLYLRTQGKKRLKALIILLILNNTYYSLIYIFYSIIFRTDRI